MTKGYYAIQAIMFHNLDSREAFLKDNPTAKPLPRLMARKLFKSELIMCGSCNGSYVQGGEIYYKEKE